VKIQTPRSMDGNANARKLQMDGDGNFDGLSAMGFDVLHRFDEIISDCQPFSLQQPS
jgi:hypothetical protein